MFLVEILKNSWDIYLEMAPYLLFGFLLAGLSYAYLPPEFIRSKLGEKGIGSVVKGALYGIPLPLCSCSTLPIAISLKRQGASLGAVGSFLISTPQTGVDSIVVTWSVLSPIFAIFRAVAAFLSGVLGGFVLDFFEVRRTVHKVKGANDPVAEKDCSAGCGCRTGSCSPPRRNFLKFTLVELPEEIGGSLFWGVLIGGIIAAVAPEDLIETTFSPGITGLFFAMLAGVPMYVCATSSVPIALAFLVKGASPGAAFVFLMTGPVTNTAQISAIYRVFGKRDLLLYLFVVCVSAIFFGLILNWMVEPVDFQGKLGGNEIIPYWLEVLSAVSLAALIVNGHYQRWKGARG